METQTRKQNRPTRRKLIPKNSRPQIVFPPGFYRPVWAEINCGNLVHNFLELSKIAGQGVSFMPVIKANAYGHGILSAAKSLAKHNPKFFGVSSIEESLLLKESGIKVPPLILGNIYPFTNLRHAIRTGTRVTVASMDAARLCEEYALKMGRPVYAHAKVDTGMNRIGVNARQGLEFITQIRRYRHIVLEGLYTHFSGSAENPEFTRQQHHLFQELLMRLEERGIHVPYVHCANSAALIKYPESRHNLVRPGISLYGFCPVVRGDQPKLKAVLHWKSRIVFVKEVPPHTPISYAGTYRTRRRSKIATAAFGYADGYRRSFSNKGLALVHGRRAPVVGRVTMDMTMLDVTDIKEARVGDEVVLLGSQGKETISVQDLAGWDNTSPYEIFCGIASRVPRIDFGGSTQS